MSITREVAENIGAALQNKNIQRNLAELLIEARLGDFFRPIMKEALAQALTQKKLEPEDFGPEIIDEALADSITTAHLAKRWLEEKRIPEMVSHLRKQYGDQYTGFEDDKTAKLVALNLLIVRDEEIVLANAVRDGLLECKKQ